MKKNERKLIITIIMFIFVLMCFNIKVYANGRPVLPEQSIVEEQGGRFRKRRDRF